MTEELETFANQHYRYTIYISDEAWSALPMGRAKYFNMLQVREYPEPLFPRNHRRCLYMSIETAAKLEAIAIVSNFKGSREDRSLIGLAVEAIGEDLYRLQRELTDEY